MDENELKLFEERLKTAFRDVDTPATLSPENVIARLDGKKNTSIKLNVKRFASLAAAFVVFVGGAVTLSFYMNSLAKGGADAAPAESVADEEAILFDSLTMGEEIKEDGFSVAQNGGVGEDNQKLESEEEDEEDDEEDKDKEDEKNEETEGSVG